MTSDLFFSIPGNNYPKPSPKSQSIKTLLLISLNKPLVCLLQHFKITWAPGVFLKYAVCEVSLGHSRLNKTAGTQTSSEESYSGGKRWDVGGR